MGFYLVGTITVSAHKHYRYLSYFFLISFGGGGGGSNGVGLPVRLYLLHIKHAVENNSC